MKNVVSCFYICTFAPQSPMNMKKLSIILVAALMMVLSMASCNDDIGTDFDKTLLYGKWQEGSVFERYDSDGTGITWDEADDITEEEGQPFNWTLNGDILTQEHLTVFGSIIPKVYTVSTLNTSNLTYYDDYGSYHYFTKVN